MQLAIAGLVIATLAGCGVAGRVAQDGRQGEVSRTGMLFVVDPAGCAIPEGCGPKYTLHDETFAVADPLLGEIRDSHHQLIVTVEGRWARLPRRERGRLSGDGPGRAIKVKRYRLVSKIPYHDFLVQKAQQFTERTYGCHLLWDKSFGWRLDDAAPRLSVRMTNTFAGGDSKPFVELEYDGHSGELVREIKSSPRLNPCA